MKTKKSLGLFLLLAGVLVTVVGNLLYGSVFAQDQNTRLFMILSLVAAALAMGLTFTSMPELPNFLTALSAIFLTAGLCISIVPMVTPIAYWYACLYDYSTVSSFFRVLTLWGVAWLLLLVSSFTGIKKTK